jgi:hypothetical protein
VIDRTIDTKDLPQNSGFDLLTSGKAVFLLPDTYCDYMIKLHPNIRLHVSREKYLPRPSVIYMNKLLDESIKDKINDMYVTIEDIFKNFNVTFINI